MLFYSFVRAGGLKLPSNYLLSPKNSYLLLGPRQGKVLGPRLQHRKT